MTKNISCHIQVHLSFAFCLTLLWLQAKKAPVFLLFVLWVSSVLCDCCAQLVSALAKNVLLSPGLKADDGIVILTGSDLVHSKMCVYRRMESFAGACLNLKCAELSGQLPQKRRRPLDLKEVVANRPCKLSWSNLYFLGLLRVAPGFGARSEISIRVSRLSVYSI